MNRVDREYAEEYLDNEESFSRRSDRRVPRGRQRRSDLVAEDAPTGELAHTSDARFSDPELQHLFEIGKIDDLLGEVKSGKEATVYLVRGPGGLMAAKVYADLRVRSFRNDEIYRRGRWIGDARIEKAIAQRTAKGVEAQQDLWVFHEYLQLWQLFEAGLPVPKPMVGPDKIDLGDAGRVVLMEYVGDDEGPAPRLSDIRLPPDEAASAFEQSVEFASRLNSLGKVHGDLSTYNLLWWRERVVAIDFPQIVDEAENPDARQLLERDVTNLCRSFRKLGVRADPNETLRRVKGGAARPGS